MKIIYPALMSVLLSGCVLDSLNTITGSTYESFDGKFIEKDSGDQTNIDKETNLAVQEEFLDIVNSRAAADKELISNPYIEKYLSEILTNLLSQWDRPVNTSISVVISADRNYAASASKDTIVITQGVLADAESEDEIAFILAHELSHILLEHNDTNEYFAKQSALVSKAANIGMSAAVIKDIKTEKTASGYKFVNQNSEESQEMFADSYRMGLTVNRLSRDVLSSAMSREYEDEADLLGMDLLVRAGYSPRAFSPVLERLESSQVYNREQLAEKKKDFQSFVSIASEGHKHVTGGNWETIGYLAANELATGALQEFSERHSSPIDRKKDLASYIKREYLQERKRKLNKVSFEKSVKQGKGNRIQENYWYASEAMRALEYGDITEAVRLAKKGVQSPTQYDAYPRLAFYSVRMAQQKQNKAFQNLTLIKNWDNASIQTFTITSQSYRELGKHSSALNTLEKAESAIGSRSPFLSEYIAIYREMGKTDEMNKILSECEKLDELKSQCFISAGQLPPEEKSNGFFDTITNLVEI